jgi:hypothetical protein
MTPDRQTMSTRHDVRDEVATIRELRTGARRHTPAQRIHTHSVPPGVPARSFSSVMRLRTTRGGHSRTLFASL